MRNRPALFAMGCRGRAGFYMGIDIVDKRGKPAIYRTLHRKVEKPQEIVKKA